MNDLILNDRPAFSEALYKKMKQVNAGVSELELYEFRYCLDNITPQTGWTSLLLESQEQIERQISDIKFYRSIQIKPCVEGRTVLDEPIVRLTNMLFVGLVTGQYPVEWVNLHFFFDIRGFFFLHRTEYFTKDVLDHLGSKPFKRFEQKQKHFERYQELGYKDFKEANSEVDQLFIKSVQKLIAKRGTPILLAIAGQTAAGKTEIVERLRLAFDKAGQKVTAIEIDNFFTDRDHREAKGINSEGKEALHFELFKRSLEDLLNGERISTPRYNFLDGSSSHDLDGNLKPDGVPVEVEPADIVFMEGNFPFLLEEIAPLIGIKVVYLTDDHVRMKRKWRRDIDLRKKYEQNYFLNRYFKEQFIMAQIAYIPQMAVCDMVVDTTGAALWVIPKIAEILGNR